MKIYTQIVLVLVFVSFTFSGIGFSLAGGHLNLDFLPFDIINIKTAHGEIQNATLEQTLDVQTLNDLDPLSKNKLLAEVKSGQELNVILKEYRDFLESPAGINRDNSTVDNNRVIAISDKGSTNIYYSINPQNTTNPQQIKKEDYSILIFKFADINNIINSTIKYSFTIQDPNDNRILLKRTSITDNGADIQVIDENTFPEGRINQPAYYQLWVNILTINGILVNEQTSFPILLKVV